jgi:hypothetical protein
VLSRRRSTAASRGAQLGGCSKLSLSEVFIGIGCVYFYRRECSYVYEYLYLYCISQKKNERSETPSKLLVSLSLLSLLLACLANTTSLSN